VSELSPIRQRIQDMNAIIDAGKPFTDTQIKWMVRAIELQQNTLDAGERYIEELTVSNLNKDIEIHELREKYEPND
jgi:hypothetical protein